MAGEGERGVGVVPDIDQASAQPLEQILHRARTHHRHGLGLDRMSHQLEQAFNPGGGRRRGRIGSPFRRLDDRERAGGVASTDFAKIQRQTGRLAKRLIQSRARVAQTYGRPIARERRRTAFFTAGEIEVGGYVHEVGRVPSRLGGERV